MTNKFEVVRVMLAKTPARPAGTNTNQSAMAAFAATLRRQYSIHGSSLALLGPGPAVELGAHKISTAKRTRAAPRTRLKVLSANIAKPREDTRAYRLVELPSYWLRVVEDSSARKPFFWKMRVLRDSSRAHL